MKNIRSLSFLLLVLFSGACSEDALWDTNGISPATRSADEYSGFLNTDDLDSVLTVGRKLANPYTVDNMDKALRNIIAASQKRSNDPLNPDFQVELSLQQIKATHYHVKFSPRTWEELELLEADSTLDLSNYPLDHEVVGSGMIYRDADDESFEDLYTAWPAEKAFPATVPYEIIDTLFIPEDETTAKRLGITENFTERLLDEAYRLTGNAEEHDKGTAASRWYPSGTLKVWDDAVNGYIPLIGARVRISKGWRYYYTDTDQFGQFRARSSFSGKVVYKILWQGSKWNIRDGTSGKAYYKSSKMSGPFNLLIGSHGRQCRFATIHRAAFRHFHLNNGFLYHADASHRVKIAYINKYNKIPGQFIGWGAWNLFGIFRDIRIWGAVNGKGWRTTQQIFNTTSHELGHCAMFYNLGRSDYNKKDEIIIESWGKFMGWLMSDIEYEQLGYYGILHKYIYINNPYMYYRFEHWDSFNLQHWNSGDLNDKNVRKYTPLFIDLYDDSNQRYYIKYFGNLGGRNPALYPNDDISIKWTFILENIAYSCRNIKEVKERVAALERDERILEEFFKIYLENNL